MTHRYAQAASKAAKRLEPPPEGLGTASGTEANPRLLGWLMAYAEGVLLELTGEEADQLRASGHIVTMDYEPIQGCTVTIHAPTERGAELGARLVAAGRG